MSARLGELAARRLELVAESDQHRAAIGAAFSNVERRLSIAERVFTIARHIHRHRTIIGAIAVWSIVRPRTARKWITAATGILPFVIEGFRILKSRD
jgi:hypothetical protein